MRPAPDADAGPGRGGLRDGPRWWANAIAPTVTGDQVLYAFKAPLRARDQRATVPACCDVGLSSGCLRRGRVLEMAVCRPPAITSRRGM